ncbi:MAG: OmpA family protein [Spirochaetes bacterium]|nr:OmpA family protein [Spirochaetota bacterium]
MKFFCKILTSLFILAISPVTIHADIFYTTKEYNNLYNQKVAAELELKSLRQQYQNDKTNLQARIRDLELEVENLSRNLDNCNRKNREDSASYEQRITELEKIIDLLKTKSSTKEKELINKTRELQEKCEKNLTELKNSFETERQKLLNEIEKLKSDYEKKLAALHREIANLNNELSDLKELTEKQKKELSRMENQAQELEKQLTEEIKKGEIRLKKYHDRIIINIDDRISFDSGQSELKKNFLPTLEKISKILAQYPEYYIIIEGHTDDVPIKTARFRNNWQLSTERALAVLDYLLKNTELDPRRFSAAGYGEYRPVVSNDTKENRALNRRVDIVVIPIVKKAGK